MDKGLELMRYIINKHIDIYKEHIIDAILDIEAISISRLYSWEGEIIHSKRMDKNLSDISNNFIENPSYGDGGMASAIRILSNCK